MLSFLHDARFAVRSLLKAPAITVVVVLTLGVAIGLLPAARAAGTHPLEALRGG